MICVEARQALERVDLAGFEDATEACFRRREVRLGVARTAEIAGEERHAAIDLGVIRAREQRLIRRECRRALAARDEQLGAMNEETSVRRTETRCLLQVWRGSLGCASVDPHTRGAHLRPRDELFDAGNACDLGGAGEGRDRLRKARGVGEAESARDLEVKVGKSAGSTRLRRGEDLGRPLALAEADVSLDAERDHLRVDGPRLRRALAPLDALAETVREAAERRHRLHGLEVRLDLERARERGAGLHDRRRVQGFARLVEVRRAQVRVRGIETAVLTHAFRVVPDPRRDVGRSMHGAARAPRRHRDDEAERPAPERR